MSLFYLTKAYDNKSIVEKYINQLTNQPGSSSGYRYSIVGDYIHTDYNYTLNSETEILRYSTNWKTGWLKYFDQRVIAPNGTTLLHMKIESLSNDLVGNIVNYSIDGVIILSLFVIVAIPSFVFYSYKKFTNSSLQNKNVSFSQFVKNKSKKRNPRKISNPTQTNKALDMIDEILQENK